MTESAELHTAQFLGADTTLGDRMGGGSTEALSQMIERGMLGRKTGKGFFLYDGKSKAKPNNPEESFRLAAAFCIGFNAECLVAVFAPLT